MRALTKILAPIVLVAGLLVAGPAPAAEAYTVGSYICNSERSERLFLSTKTSGSFKNVSRGNCINGADYFYVPSGCRALVNLRWLSAGGYRTSVFGHYMVAIDC